MRQESQPLASTATQTHAVVAIPAGAWRPAARQLPAVLSVCIWSYRPVFQHYCLQVHGDLKPANCLLRSVPAYTDRRGVTVKLADFGLSRLLNPVRRWRWSFEWLGGGAFKQNLS